MLTATAFVAVPSLMFGAIEVLVPLRIDDLGGGHAVIAGSFIVGAALEAGLAPLSGRYSDRVGRRAPFVSGLAVAAVGMLGLAVAQGVGVVVAALLVASLGAGLCFAPALTMLAETSESGPLQEGLAAGLSNMAWASGQVIGGVLGGAVAGMAGYAAPSIAVAVVLVATAGVCAAPRASAPPPPGLPRARLGRWPSGATGRGTRPAGRASWSARATATSWPARWRAAAAERRPISVAGSGHSFTEAAMTDGTMIDVGALSGVIDADPASGLVTVGGGTVLADLNQRLHELGLAMENLGDIDRQTIAGSISTGTHGTGARLRNISSQVAGDRAGPRRRQRP